MELHSHKKTKSPKWLYGCTKGSGHVFLKSTEERNWSGNVKAGTPQNSNSGNVPGSLRDSVFVTGQECKKGVLFPVSF